MPIISIRGQQDTGKTALMTGFIIQILAIGQYRADGYRPDDVYVNFKLNIPGTHSLTNQEMRKFLLDMVKKGFKHKIIGITEADRVFPARFWQNREQSEALIGLWQDMKLFNIIFWDSHIGTSVDVMLRETRQVGMIPKYDKKNDCINFVILNGLYRRKIRRTLFNVSKTVFPFYDRWEVID
jgi:hypothetical protein